MAVIFQFVSTAGRGLFAFTSDGAGVMLPGRHGPWVLEGSILEGQPIPHDLDRATIERAIDADGYQLWRMKGRRGSGKAD